MSRAQARRIWSGAWLVVGLAGVGGFVDGVGFLALLGMFTSHMSGNSIRAGVSLGEAGWSEAVRFAFPVPVFVTGAALGTALSEVFARRGVRSAHAPLFGLEALLLALFAACGTDQAQTGTAWTFYALAALPALAMGIQSQALRRAGGLPVHTTFITGLLTTLSEQVVQLAFWLAGRRRSLRLRLVPRRLSFHRTLLLLGLWAGYVLGAVAGAWAWGRWGPLSLSGPIACLAFLAVLDVARPVGPRRGW